MPTNVTAPVDSPWTKKAIITLDPAGAGESGIAARATASLPADPKRGRLRDPDYTYQGSIWNDVLYDDLGVWLAKNVGQTGKVLLAVEDCAFRSMTIARSIGTAIGCLRGFLVGTGWLDQATKPLMITPNQWRRCHWPVHSNRPKGRAEQKQAAIDLVRILYGYGDYLQDDLAEAILLNDFVVLDRQETWK